MGIMKKENSVLTGVSGEGFMKEGSLWPGIDYFNKHFLVTCVCLALCWELHFKGWEEISGDSWGTGREHSAVRSFMSKDKVSPGKEVYS